MTPEEFISIVIDDYHDRLMNNINDKFILNIRKEKRLIIEPILKQDEFIKRVKVLLNRNYNIDRGNNIVCGKTIPIGDKFIILMNIENIFYKQIYDYIFIHELQHVIIDEKLKNLNLNLDMNFSSIISEYYATYKGYYYSKLIDGDDSIKENIKYINENPPNLLDFLMIYSRILAYSHFNKNYEILKNIYNYGNIFRDYNFEIKNILKNKISKKNINKLYDLYINLIKLL